MFWEGYTETVDLDEVDYYKQRGYSVVTSENLEDVVGVIKQLGTTTNSKDKSSKQEFASRLLDGLISSFIETYDSRTGQVSKQLGDNTIEIPDEGIPGRPIPPYDEYYYEFYKYYNGKDDDYKSISGGFDYGWTGKYVTPEFKAKVLEICEKLKMDPDDLMAIMAFESGFNPSERNPRSGATGLIQWMPSTAKGYGTTTDALAKMSAVKQLDYVYEYFKPYAGKIHNIQDAYMVVFMPIAVGKDNDYVLGEKGSNKIFYGKVTYGKIYEDNSVLDHDKDGTIHKWEAAQEVIDTRERYKKNND